ncbi:hypothetical protein NDU88_003615 [Pleurodeles waltl]|uniref:Uncharacterized protein n=1 Tax=Pleurodeles waltl TaxID=8319 RepID=A0AAV7W584_PLEWA|nr:hypothetical protein NDU88_003615 [Pleurodeles waltl]
MHRFHTVLFPREKSQATWQFLQDPLYSVIFAGNFLRDKINQQRSRTKKPNLFARDCVRFRDYDQLTLPGFLPQ